MGLLPLFDTLSPNIDANLWLNSSTPLMQIFGFLRNTIDAHLWPAPFYPLCNPQVYIKVTNR